MSTDLVNLTDLFDSQDDLFEFVDLDIFADPSNSVYLVDLVDLVDLVEYFDFVDLVDLVYGPCI